MSQCNYCGYQTILRTARAQGKKVTKTPRPGDNGSWRQGVDIEVDGEFVAWYAELPDHCCC